MSSRGSDTTVRVPYISVVVPVYQCENTLECCIESIIAQGDYAYEVVLVDDGSTDASGRICDSYRDSQPNLYKVIHKQNEGPLAARLDGIDAARGRYLMFLDSDDIYLPGLFEAVLSEIEVTDTDMVIFNHYRTYPDGSRTLYKTLYETRSTFEEQELIQIRRAAVSGYALNALWQKCIRKELLFGLDVYRQYGNMRIGEDKLLSLELIDRAKTISYLPEGLYEYHISSQSISHHLTLSHYVDMSRAYESSLDYAKKWGLVEAEEACHKEKVESALACLSSTATNKSRIQGHPSEFSELAEYIAADEVFWSAYDECVSALSPSNRLACQLLKAGKVKALESCFKAFAAAKNGINKLRCCR